MLDVLGSDFLRTPRPRTDPAARVLQARPAHRADPDGHVVRLSVSACWWWAGVFTESIFNWQGMGAWLVQGINDRTPT